MAQTLSETQRARQRPLTVRVAARSETPSSAAHGPQARARESSHRAGGADAHARFANLAHELLRADTSAGARECLRTSLEDGPNEALRGLGLGDVKSALEQAGASSFPTPAGCGPLLPLQLLAFALPRTEEQRSAALARLDLAARSTAAPGPQGSTSADANAR